MSRLRAATYERSFAAAATHRLCNPLAALRLQLEDLATWPEVTPRLGAELARALGNVDRITRELAGLLDERACEPLPGAGSRLAPAIDVVRERWTPVLAAGGSGLRIDAPVDLGVAVPATALGCLLEDLLGLVVARDSDEVRVTVTCVGSYVRVVVTTFGDPAAPGVVAAGPCPAQPAGPGGPDATWARLVGWSEVVGGRVLVPGADPRAVELLLPLAA